MDSPLSNNQVVLSSRRTGGEAGRERGAHSFPLLMPLLAGISFQTLAQHGLRNPLHYGSVLGDRKGADTSTSGGQIWHLPEEDPGPAWVPELKDSLRVKLVSSGRRNGLAPLGVLAPCQVPSSPSLSAAPCQSWLGSEHPQVESLLKQLYGQLPGLCQGLPCWPLLVGALSGMPSFRGSSLLAVEGVGFCSPSLCFQPTPLATAGT